MEKSKRKMTKSQPKAETVEGASYLNSLQTDSEPHILAELMKGLKLFEEEEVSVRKRRWTLS